jgi:glycosyltransferase involved in cell wall biosynthesis
MAEGLNCRFVSNASRAQLKELYAESAFLVHAAGFGLDPLEFPECLEHFGITPVEAASFGCIPVAYGEGGPVEVLAQLGCETTFLSREECVRKILDLRADPDRATRLSRLLPERAEQFSAAAFQQRVNEALRALAVPGPW